MKQEPTGLIHKAMLKSIQDKVLFEIVLTGTTFNPKFIRGVIEVAFEQAENLGLNKIIDDEYLEKERTK